MRRRRRAISVQVLLSHVLSEAFACCYKNATAKATIIIATKAAKVSSIMRPSLYSLHLVNHSRYI